MKHSGRQAQHPKPKQAMKLSYHTGNNVGDALNPLVFEHFLGKEFFDKSTDTHLLGIGSILGLKRSLPGKKIVFSSGWADDTSTYGAMPSIDETFDVRAVRGPLTASALGLSKNTAVTDGAYLVPDVLKIDIPREQRADVGFIPHHKSLDFYPDWNEISESIGMTFLDVRLPPELFIRKLWSCKYVISEAMHGVILADAYRIPWVPIRLYPHINEFKWQDWAQSLSIELIPNFAPTTLASAEFYSEILTKRKVPSAISPALASIVLARRKQKLMKWLRKLTLRQQFMSDPIVLHDAVDKLREQIYRIKKDYAPQMRHQFDEPN